jgi:hypothetical protein
VHCPWLANKGSKQEIVYRERIINEANCRSSVVSAVDCGGCANEAGCKKAGQEGRREVLGWRE